MMLAHQPAIGAFDGGIINIVGDTQQGIGIVDRAGPLAIGAAELMLDFSLNQGFDLRQFTCTETQIAAKLFEYASLGDVNSTIGVCGVNLNFHEHAQQISAACFPRQLIENVFQRKSGSFAFAKQVSGKFTQVGRQFEAVHDLFGEADLVSGDLAIGLGQVAHDREGRRKECRLHTLGVLKSRRRALSLIELMSGHRAKHGAQGPAEHEADRPADCLAPPAHERVPRPVAQARKQPFIGSCPGLCPATLVMHTALASGLGVVTGGDCVLVFLCNFMKALFFVMWLGVDVQAADAINTGAGRVVHKVFHSVAHRMCA